MTNPVSSILNFGGYRLASPAEAVKNLKKIALPALGLIAACATLEVSADKAAYDACVQSCLAVTSGGFRAACYAVCAPFLAA